jgi:hypothetical protein
MVWPNVVVLERPVGASDRSSEGLSVEVDSRIRAMEAVGSEEAGDAILLKSIVEILILSTLQNASESCHCCCCSVSGRRLGDLVHQELPVQPLSSMQVLSRR